MRNFKIHSWSLYLLLVCAPFAQAEKIKVLTYNTWGVPVATWDHWRYGAAMTAIEKLDPDVVLLNEMFTTKARKNFLSYRYPYVADGARWFPRLVGSGLRILSKFPFSMHAILTYGNCKKDDCLSRKGAALVTLELPHGKKLNVVGTHLNASGGESTRIAQVKQLQIFSDYYQDAKVPTVIAGDFNFGPQSNEYEFSMKHLGVSDAWSDTHSTSEPGVTYDCYDNHYAHDYTIKTKGSLFKDRIDYFFHRGAIQTLSTAVVFNGQDDLYSDHYGLMGEFEI